MIYQMEIKTAQENDTNMRIVSKWWNLGPLKTSVQPTDNKEYWSKMALVWNITEEKARTQLCANCEYANNTPNMMLQMNAIPLNSFDMDGGGRTYCHRFEFICHNLRSCMAFEPREYKLEELEKDNHSDF